MITCKSEVFSVGISGFHHNGWSTSIYWFSLDSWYLFTLLQTSQRNWNFHDDLLQICHDFPDMIGCLVYGWLDLMTCLVGFVLPKWRWGTPRPPPLMNDCLLASGKFWYLKRWVETVLTAKTHYNSTCGFSNLIKAKSMMSWMFLSEFRARLHQSGSPGYNRSHW